MERIRTELEELECHTSYLAEVIRIVDQDTSGAESDRRTTSAFLVTLLNQRLDRMDRLEELRIAERKKIEIQRRRDATVVFQPLFQLIETPFEPDVLYSSECLHEMFHAYFDDHYADVYYGITEPYPSKVGWSVDGRVKGAFGDQLCYDYRNKGYDIDPTVDVVLQQELDGVLTSLAQLFLQ